MTTTTRINLADRRFWRNTQNQWWSAESLTGVRGSRIKVGLVASQCGWHISLLQLEKNGKIVPEANRYIIHNLATGAERCVKPENLQAAVTA